MGKYSGIDKVKVEFGHKKPGLYSFPGDHLLEVEVCRDGESPTTGGVFFAADLKVKASSDENLVGQSVAWVNWRGTFPGAPQKWLTDIVKFVAAVGGEDPTLIELSEDQIEAIVGDDNPLGGNEVRCTVEHVTKANRAGEMKDYKFVAFRPAE